MKRLDYSMCTCELCGGSVSFEESPDGAYVFYDEAAAEVAAALEAEMSRRVEHRQMNQSLNEQVQRLESRAEALQARVAELEAENERLLGDYYGGRTYDYEASERRAVAAESELADLRGRVEALVPDGCLSVFASAIREALRGR